MCVSICKLGILVNGSSTANCPYPPETSHSTSLSNEASSWHKQQVGKEYKMSEHITLSNDFPQCSGEKGVKNPPESNEELTFATGSGEKREKPKKKKKMGVYKTFMKIFFDLILWSCLKAVS